MKDCTLMRTSLPIWVSITLIHQWDRCPLGHTWRAPPTGVTIKMSLRSQQGAHADVEGRVEMLRGAVKGHVEWKERCKARWWEYYVRKVDMKGMCIGRNSCKKSDTLLSMHTIIGHISQK